MRSEFDEQLTALNRELIMMGARCEEAIALTSKAFSTGDKKLLSKVNKLEAELDHDEREIESMCLKMLLRQQPVARDLRHISAALKMITDMERIGDQASDIAEIIGYLGNKKAFNYSFVTEMSKEVINMVTGSVDAYVKQDIKLANEVIEHDNIVDRLFSEGKKSLIEMITDSPCDGEMILDILMISKYLERIGDHTTNIAEWVVFSVTGRHKKEGEDL